MLEFGCPKCKKLTSNFGKYADEYFCVKCNLEFNPSLKSNDDLHANRSSESSKSQDGSETESGQCTHADNPVKHK